MFNHVASFDDMERLRAQLASDMSAVMPQMPKAIVKQQIDVMTSDAYRFLVRFDPKESIKGTRCPVLALYGEWDVQVSAEANSSAIKALLPMARVETLPHHNHMMQESGDRAQSFYYGEIGHDISPLALNIIKSFILTTTEIE